jgi:predicted metal-dependent peptidase
MVDSSFKLPKGALIDMKYFGMSAEEIYDTLPKGKSQKQQQWCDKGGWDKDKQGKGDGKSKQQQGKSGAGGLFDDIAKMFGGKKPLPKSTMTDEEKDEKWKRLYEKTFLENYGKLPDSIKRVIEKSYYIPVVDWASLVSSLLSEDINDYTFSQPDRRFLDGDFLLPDLYSFDKLKDVVFSYDTSGSISEDDLKSFYLETLNLFSNFSSLQGWIGVCDADLHSFKEVGPQQSFSDFDFVGGGGTDFRPVFEEISRRNMKPKALFYFTDTEGSFPREAPEYPVFWLVKSQIGESYKLDVPFGTVIRFLTKT